MMKISLMLIAFLIATTTFSAENAVVKRAHLSRKIATVVPGTPEDLKLNATARTCMTKLNVWSETKDHPVTTDKAILNNFFDCLDGDGITLMQRIQKLVVSDAENFGVQFRSQSLKDNLIQVQAAGYMEKNEDKYKGMTLVELVVFYALRLGAI
jgi:hypothetical protein